MLLQNEATKFNTQGPIGHMTDGGDLNSLISFNNSDLRNDPLRTQHVIKSNSDRVGKAQLGTIIDNSNNKRGKIKKKDLVKIEHSSCGLGCRPKRVSEASSS